MKLAVVGSRRLGGKKSRDIIIDYISKNNITAIVSGGATGIDSLAENIADELGIAKIIFLPEINQWEDSNGKIGFRSRNHQIANECDALLYIEWDRDEQEKTFGKKASYGGGWTRDEADRLGKPTKSFSLTIAEDEYR